MNNYWLNKETAIASPWLCWLQEVKKQLPTCLDDDRTLELWLEDFRFWYGYYKTGYSPAAAVASKLSDD